MPDEISSHTMETAIPAWMQHTGVHARSESVGRIPYEEYLRQRHAFVEAGQRGRQRLDQLLVAGATGALVLSVTFLERIAPTPVAASRPLLLVGWVVLLLALGVSMLGFEASSRAFEEGVRSLDRHQKSGLAYDPTTNPWDRRTAQLNRVSLVLFFAGIVLLVAFAFVNVPFASSSGAGRAPVPSAGVEAGAEASAP